MLGLDLISCTFLKSSIEFGFVGILYQYCDVCGA